MRYYKTKVATLVFVILVLLRPAFTFSQTTGTPKPVVPKTAAKKTRILFLFDASASMVDSWGQSASKIDVAKRVLCEIVDTLNKKQNMEIGLRVFGDQSITSKNDCSDTRLEVPFGPNNIPLLKETINHISPKGVTPIALSIEKSAADFPADPNARNIIILITDGEESCGGDPCAIGLALQKSGVFLRPFIIGLNLDNSLLTKLECLGAFYNAQDPIGFRQAITTIIQKVLNPIYVQVNLLDQQGHPVESDVDMTFYDSNSGAPKYDYVHTINYKGMPDTLNLDPVLNYDLVIHTTPPVERKNITLVQGKNNIINVPTPQGYLLLKLTTNTINNNINNKIRCLVRVGGETVTTCVQDINTTEKYLTGKYDLEFLTLPRTVINKVDISQSETTTIEIPAPGIFSVMKPAPGYGAIFSINNSQLQKIYTLGENGGNEVIALQPGTYKIIYKPKFSKKTTDTEEKTFTITSGGSASVQF